MTGLVICELMNGGPDLALGRVEDARGNNQKQDHLEPAGSKQWQKFEHLDMPDKNDIRAADLQSVPAESHARSRALDPLVARFLLASLAIPITQ